MPRDVERGARRRAPPRSTSRGCAHHDDPTWYPDLVLALLFDLDGTLVDSERQCAESVARALASGGRVMTQAERDFVIGHGWNEIYANLLEGGALPMSRDALIAQAGKEREHIVDTDGLVVLPGGVELVRAAREAGLRVAIVSGSSRGEIEDAIRRLGIAADIELYVGAEDVPRGKPAPDGYLLALDRLGLVASEAIVIEDSTAGISAGLAAGTTVLAARAGNFARQRQDHAHHVVESLAEIDLTTLAALRARTHARGAP